MKSIIFLACLLVLCVNHGWADKSVTSIDASDISLIDRDSITTASGSSSTISAVSATSTTGTSSITTTTSMSSASISTTTTSVTSTSTPAPSEGKGGTIAVAVILGTFLVSGIVIISIWQVRLRIRDRQNSTGTRGAYEKHKSTLSADVEIAMFRSTVGQDDSNRRREIVRDNVFNTDRPISPPPQTYSNYSHIIPYNPTRQAQDFPSVASPRIATALGPVIGSASTAPQPFIDSQTSHEDALLETSRHNLHRQFSFEEWPLSRPNPTPNDQADA